MRRRLIDRWSRRRGIHHAVNQWLEGMSQRQCSFLASQCIYIVQFCDRPGLLVGYLVLQQVSYTGLSCRSWRFQIYNHSEHLDAREIMTETYHVECACIFSSRLRALSRSYRSHTIPLAMFPQAFCNCVIDNMWRTFSVIRHYRRYSFSFLCPESGYAVGIEIRTPDPNDFLNLTAVIPCPQLHLW